MDYHLWEISQQGRLKNSKLAKAARISFDFEGINLAEAIHLILEPA